MFFGPGINWWYWGAPSSVPPGPGDDVRQVGDIDIFSILIVLLAEGMYNVSI